MTNNFEKEEIKAVHDQDLEKVLENFKLLRKLRRGELMCFFCKTVITMENLHSFFPKSGSVKFVCDSTPCIKKVYEFINEGEIKA